MLRGLRFMETCVIAEVPSVLSPTARSKKAVSLVRKALNPKP